MIEKISVYENYAEERVSQSDDSKNPNHFTEIKF